jgi:hypothetical protein
MHLKSYQIDGKLLRTGAANFSASGLKRQDNDLIVIESAVAAAAFKQAFDVQYDTGEALAAGAKRYRSVCRDRALLQCERPVDFEAQHGVISCHTISNTMLCSHFSHKMRASHHVLNRRRVSSYPKN